MKPSSILRTAAVAASLATSPLFAAIEYGTGNINAVDWKVMQVEIKTPKGGLVTYKVAPNVEVKFTDGASDFPNPTYRDLAPPMYVHFSFENRIISTFDVREVGSAPRRSAQGGSPSGSANVLKIRIMKIYDRGDTIEADVAGRKQSFQLDSRDVIRGFHENDLVVATLARRNGRDVITELKRSR